MKKILILDNYDSFVYNLAHYLATADCEVHVIRNDCLSLDDVAAYEKILLSPGPGIPDEAGLLKAIIEKYAPTKSILGVCLGQQAIAEVFGGELTNLDKVMHGVSTWAYQLVEDEPIYRNIPKKFQIGRYHSWAVHPQLPNSLEATAVDADGQIMSLRHRIYNLRAVQFHPESVLTPFGKQLVQNWLAHE